jgi:hypothetical protein
VRLCRPRRSAGGSDCRSSRANSAAFSIGWLGRDKSDLFNGEGPINGLLSRGHRRLFAMRLTRHNCAADESGPSPHMAAGAFDDRVLDSPIFHIARTCGGRSSFPASGIHFRSMSRADVAANLGALLVDLAEPL